MTEFQKNREVYIPISMPKKGETMTYIQADLVIRDADGTEVVGTEVIVENTGRTSTTKVLMSLEQGIHMIGMLLAQSGLTTKDVMRMVEEAHQKVYAEMDAEVVEAMRNQTDGLVGFDAEENRIQSI